MWLSKTPSPADCEAAEFEYLVQEGLVLPPEAQEPCRGPPKAETTNLQFGTGNGLRTDP